jgi:hypothetical protein
MLGASLQVGVVWQGTWDDRRNRFLVDGYEPVSLIMWLAEECFRLTGGRVSVVERGMWLTLEADVDWLEGWDDPFHRLTPTPQLGPNTVSLLAATVAFGTAVATWTTNGWEVVSGQAQLPSDHPPSSVRRVVAFQR